MQTFLYEGFKKEKFHAILVLLNLNGTIQYSQAPLKFMYMPIQLYLHFKQLMMKKIANP